MENILCLVAVSALFASASALNCTAKSDGAYEIGCRSYGVCKGSVLSIIDCPTNMVYNSKGQMCDDPANVEAPCGDLKNCDGKADGLFADVDQNCHTYYTCNHEKFLGHNFCAADLVFDESLNTCNYKDAVRPPCGTLGVAQP